MFNLFKSLGTLFFVVLMASCQEEKIPKEIEEALLIVDSLAQDNQIAIFNSAKANNPVVFIGQKFVTFKDSSGNCNEDPSDEEVSGSGSGVIIPQAAIQGTDAFIGPESENEMIIDIMMDVDTKNTFNSLDSFNGFFKKKILSGLNIEFDFKQSKQITVKKRSQSNRNIEEWVSAYDEAVAEAQSDPNVCSLFIVTGWNLISIEQRLFRETKDKNEMKFKVIAKIGNEFHVSEKQFSKTDVVVLDVEVPFRRLSQNIAPRPTPIEAKLLERALSNK